MKDSQDFDDELDAIREKLLGHELLILAQGTELKVLRFVLGEIGKGIGITIADKNLQDYILHASEREIEESIRNLADNNPGRASELAELWKRIKPKS